MNNGGATTEAMMKGKGEEAYIAAFKLHVTGALCAAACSTCDVQQYAAALPVLMLGHPLQLL